MLTRTFNYNYLLSSLVEHSTTYSEPFNSIFSSYKSICKSLSTLTSMDPAQTNCGESNAPTNTAPTPSPSETVSKTYLDCKKRENELKSTLAVHTTEIELNKSFLESLDKQRKEMALRCEEERHSLQLARDQVRNIKKDNERRIEEVQLEVEEIKSRNLIVMEVANKCMKCEEEIQAELEEIKRTSEFMQEREQVFRRYMVVEMFSSNKFKSAKKIYDFNKLDVTYAMSSQIIAHTDSITTIDMFRESPSFLTTSKDKQIKLWNVNNEVPIKALNTFAFTNPNFVVPVEEDNNLNRLLTGDNSGELIMWDFSFKAKKFTIPAHKEAILTGGFYVDSQTFYTGSLDKTLKLWDIERLKIIQTHMCHSPCLTSASQGDIIYTGHKDGTLKYWNKAIKTEIFEFKFFGARLKKIKVSGNGIFIVRKVVTI